MQRAFFYSDESHHHHGRPELFAVAGLVVSAHANVIKEKLIRAERQSGKGTVKWNRTKDPKIRRRYLEEILKIPQLQGCAFCVVHDQPVNPFQATVGSLQRAVEHFGNGRRCVLVHQGFNHETRQRLRQDLMEAGVAGDITVEPGSMANEPRVRLADALAGFICLMRSGSHTVDLYSDLPHEGWFTDLS